MDEARAQELLANQRARLERLLKAEIAATAPDSGDEVDDANWRIAEETGRAVSRSLRDRWSALQRAEERLKRGTYGRSVASGEPIPEERMEADPLAELLVTEAAIEAFRARQSAETVSGLASTRRTLAALADREDVVEEPRRPAARGRRPAAREAPVVVEDRADDDEPPAEDDDIEVAELDGAEGLIDEDDAAEFGAADDQGEDQEGQEGQEGRKGVAGAAEGG